MHWWIAISVLGLIWLALLLWPGARLTVLFDGSCPMCRRTMRCLRLLNWSCRLEPQSMREWDMVHARFPELVMADCEKDMHAVDAHGRVFRGYRAYQSIAWRLPLIAPLAWILWLPPISTMGSRIYRRVADRRMIEGCGVDACEIRPPQA